ncbi:MAG TPA: hypothetical protein VGQ26_07920 [Streptosporangiaceae bacterium]|nr:hypothetical protein [Streptosporangiaceae bacterium]
MVPISQRSSPPGGPGGAGRAEAHGQSDGADDLWPDDDEAAGQPGGSPPAGAAGQPWQAPEVPPARPPRRWRWPVALILTGLAAAAAGAGIVALLHGSSGPGAASAAPGGQPSHLASVPSGGDGTPPGGGELRMLIAGPVTAVSGTSITIGGQGRPVTAAVTGATRITGKVSSISGIRVGDQVSAQITQEAGGKPTAVAIQDPARRPLGGSLP